MRIHKKWKVLSHRAHFCDHFLLLFISQWFLDLTKIKNNLKNKTPSEGFFSLRERVYSEKKNAFLTTVQSGCHLPKSAEEENDCKNEAEQLIEADEVVCVICENEKVQWRCGQFKVNKLQCDLSGQPSE